MVKMVKLEQGTPEWLAWRLNGITATEAACAIGASKWGTALSVYNSKLNPQEQTEKSAVQEWGTEIEPLLRKKFQSNHPEYRIEQGECYEDDWRKCSLDGECIPVHSDLPLAILECKTGRNAADWDLVPDGYYAQVQWQMHVTGRRKCFFAVLINGYEYFERTVEYDPEYAAKLENACKKLWDCICTKVPPPIDPKHASIDQDCINQMAAAEQDKDEMFEVPEADACAYLLLQEQFEILKAKLDNAKAKLSSYLIKHKRLSFKGMPFGTLVYCRGKESVDAKALKQNYPEVYDKVLKAGKPYSYPKFG